MEEYVDPGIDRYAPRHGKGKRRVYDGNSRIGEGRPAKARLFARFRICHHRPRGGFAARTRSRGDGDHRQCTELFRFFSGAFPARDIVAHGPARGAQQGDQLCRIERAAASYADHKIARMCARKIHPFVYDRNGRVLVDFSINKGFHAPLCEQRLNVREQRRLFGTHAFSRDNGGALSEMRRIFADRIRAACAKHDFPRDLRYKIFHIILLNLFDFGFSYFQYTTIPVYIE